MATKIDPGTPPPPVEHPALQAATVARIERDLDDSGWFGRVSADEVRDTTAAIAALPAADAIRVIDRLAADGKLDKFAAKSVESGWFAAGLSTADTRSFLGELAGKLDAPRLAALSAAYGKAGAEPQQLLAEAVARGASPDTKLAFVAATAGATTDGGKPGVLGGSYVDGDARAAATVIGSLRGDYAARAFTALTADQQAAVFRASTGLNTALITSEYSSTMLADVDPKGFAQLMDAARSIGDPAVRAQILNAAADSVAATAKVDGVTDRQAAPLARAVIGALDAPSLAKLPPEQVAALAATAAKGDPAGLVVTLSGVATQPPTPARDALIRTLFLKTDGGAYAAEPQLATAMGLALARTQSSDPARIGANGRGIADLLRTDAGRSLLADGNVNPAARLWAMTQVAADPAKVAGQIAGHDKAWEAPALVQSYAAARTDQFAVARGDAGVTLQGGSDFANFVGGGLGAPLRKDAPATADALQSAQVAAQQGGYDFYSGVEAVQKPAIGIAEAQHQLGGGPVSVSVLPVQFASQATGPVDLQLYRVEAGGQSRFVDNSGRVYQNFDGWKNENELPPGQMTYPADGHLGAPGTTALETRNTPKVSDTFWEHVRDVADVAALVGGVVASGVILLGSGGTATPLVAGAWAVALGSAAYTGVRAAGDLNDRAQHGQSLSLADPDARAAWLSLAGSGLTVAGAGATRLVGLAAEDSALAVNGARAAGVLNASANWADAAGTANTAASLASNWDRLSPTERAQMGLQIAFWGGMTGLSAKAGGGKLTDAFNFRAQINHAMLETGAGIRANPELAAGEASVVAQRNAAGGIADLRVEYGPGTSKEVIDAHMRAARELISNAGAEGAMKRAFGSADAYRPGTRGEEVSLEVAKHEALLGALDARLNAAGLSDADRTALTRAQGDTRFELSAYRNELAAIKADPALGRAAGTGSIDVKQSAQHWLDPAGSVSRDALAQTSFAGLRTGVAADFPNAQRVTLNRNGSLTLADGSEITNFGPRTNTLQRIVDPQSAGGYGGAVFYDRASNTVIAAVNMRTAGNAGSVTRVEVPFAKNAAGEWRADFTQLAPFKTAIQPALIRDRGEHFKAANQNLRDALASDPTLAGRLGLTPEGLAAVRSASGTSPAPFTWHHVDGGGRIWLVDSAVHGLFLHTGGFSEWATGGTLRAR